MESSTTDKGGALMALDFSVETALEYKTIGAALINPHFIKPMRAFLEPSDFMVLPLGRIYGAMCKLDESGTPPTIDLLLSHNQSLFDEIGYDFLSGVTSLRETESLKGLHFARRVAETGISRNVQTASEKLGSKAFHDLDGALIEAERVLAINRRRLAIDTNTTETHADLTNRVYEDLMAPHDPERDGLWTGLNTLDDKLRGLKRGNLIVVAGRPSLGKTALATTILWHVGIGRNTPTAMFSLEMSREEMEQKLFTLETDIPYQRVISHRLTPVEKRQLEHAREVIAAAPVEMLGPEKRDIEYLVAEAHRLHDKMGLRLLMVDYLQLLGASKRHENRQQEVSYISRELKSLARSLDIPVIAVSQLNRQPEQRAHGEPTLADLRESGGIEQDADVVMMLFWPKDRDAANLENVDKVAAKVAKNRLGEQTLVMLGFHRDRMKFVDIKDQRYDGAAPDWMNG